MPDPVTLALAVKRANAYTDSNISEGGGIPLSQKGAADGVAALDADGYVTAIRGAIDGRPFGTYSVEEFGAVGDGITDDTAAIQAAITAVGATGGTLQFGPRKYLITGQLRLPTYTLGGRTVQRPQRWVGSGYSHAFGTGTPDGGTRLDLRYADGPKIITTGEGMFELTGLTLMDDSAGEDENDAPFLLTTYTAIHAHHMAVVGNPGKQGATCDQDAFILGGTTAAYDDTDDAAFKGYGTVIDSVQFHRVRRCVWWRTWANSVVARNNHVSFLCGTNGTGTSAPAAFDIDSSFEGSYAKGNVVDGNLIETAGYVYPIALRGIGATLNILTNNTFWDAGAGTLADYLADGASNNFIIHAGYTDTPSRYAENGSASNRLIGAGGVWYNNFIFDVSQPNRTALEARAHANQSDDIFRVKKADNTKYWFITSNGRLESNGGQGNAVPFKVTNNTAGASVAQMWNQAKGGIQVGNGGGAPLEIVNGSGVAQVRFYFGTTDPEGSLTAPVGSIYIRTSGGAGTTLYVKETGTGNTGWAAK